jgi:hypothetical protein
MKPIEQSILMASTWSGGILAIAGILTNNGQLINIGTGVYCSSGICYLGCDLKKYTGSYIGLPKKK